MKVKLNDKKYEGNTFYDSDRTLALENSQSDGYRPVFMNELADLRIEADKESELWQKGFVTPSLKATGKTNQKSKVVVYSHVDNYFSNPENIRKAIKQGLVNYAGKIPQDEFQKTVDMDGKTDKKGNRLVWVIPYENLKESPSAIIPVNEALEHPQTIPFLGGEERAKKYLNKFKEVHGKNIGIWHSDDLSDEALGRLLVVGNNCNNGLNGNVDLDNNAQFFGVRELGAEGVAQKISESPKKPEKVKAPNLEEILQFSRKFVPEIARKEYESGLKNFFE